MKKIIAALLAVVMIMTVAFASEFETLIGK